MTHFSKLEELIGRKNQRFVCTNIGHKGEPSKHHIAKITHDTSPPLSADEVDNLALQLPEAPEILDFYKKYGSARLYRDTVFCKAWGGYESGFYIAHPEEWEELRDCFNDWLYGLSQEEEEELIPNWIDDYVVIGEVPNSGNYFIVPLVGSDSGSVYEFEHDGFEFIKRGDTFLDFVEHLCTVTDDLILEISSHTHYQDGITTTQWRADRYEYG